MPTITCEISVHDNGNHWSAGGGIFWDSSAIIESLEDLGFEEQRKIPRGNPGRWVRVRALEKDPRWPLVWRILKDHGLEWFPHFIERRAFNDREYTIRRERVYSREEICQAELLRLAGSQRKFAEFAPDRSGEVYVVELSQHLKSKIDFGCSHYHVSVLMSGRLKDALEAEGLTAVNFKEASYEKPPKPDTKRLWQFGSTVKMPACQTVRQDTHGNFVNDDGPPAGSLGYYWDDAGFQPAELVYNRAEVEQLPPFDIAMTREFVGEPFAPYREIIVTQRFREAMEKHGVKTADWAPVRLI